MDTVNLRPFAEKAILDAVVRENPNSYEATQEPIEDAAPVAIDLVQFVMWLRADTDFFSGPNLDQHHPGWDHKDFKEVLAELALKYTGEA